MAYNYIRELHLSTPSFRNSRIKDVLDLIPEYSAKNAIEFVHFFTGCYEACSLLGFENEKLLLKFVKLKLRGLAHSMFALDAPKFSSMSSFINTMQAEFHRDLRELAFWTKQVRSSRQKVGESAREYGARMEDILRCAWYALDMPGPYAVCSDEWMESARDSYPAISEKMWTDFRGLKALAVREFKKNMISERVRDYKNDPDDSHGDILDAVLAAEEWEKVHAKTAKCKICNSLFHTDDKCYHVEGVASSSYSKGSYLLGPESYSASLDLDLTQMNI